LQHFKNPYLEKLTDAAVINIAHKKFAFTTDSFVVKPLFFHGADIGKLAVCGTINDLLMMGAIPRYLSCAIIIEEGLDYKILELITKSIAQTAEKTKVQIVTGDVKVVEKGSCDGLFINTSGVGEIIKNLDLSVDKIKISDKIIINGPIANHGIAVLAARNNLDFKNQIKSDCASLHSLLDGVLKNFSGIRFMRDPTRGGLATTLNEIIKDKRFGILLDEKNIPVEKKVRSACEILGFDPLYIANEGKVVIVAERKQADKILKKLKTHPLGKGSRIIGKITEEAKGKVILKTIIGGRRIVDMLVADPLPRIC
jgi:hydrogenase expression/formation protein HypE